MALKGRCLCGDIRYQIENAPEVMGVCHCKHCQRQTGSAFSTMAGVPKAEFTLRRGHPRTYQGPTDSGDAADTLFCGRCGSAICTALANQPELLFVKTGTLEDTSWFRPSFHAWCENKQNWLVIEEGVSHTEAAGDVSAALGRCPAPAEP